MPSTVYLTLRKVISQTDMSQNLKKRTAPRSRASLIVLITLALLLMVAAIVLVVSLPDDQAWQLPTTAETDLDLGQSGFACAASEAQQIYPFGTGVVKLSSSSVVMLNINGAEQFAVDLDYSAPFAVSNGQYFLAADREGHAFVMIDSQGERFRGTLDGRISGASISAEGYLAIVEDINDSTGIVKIYDPKGSLLFYVDLPNAGFVLSVSFPAGENSFDVALVNVAEAAAKPVIKRFSLTGQAIGQRIPDLSEIYPLIAYDEQGNPVLCSASHLAALSYNSDTLIWQQSFQQILAVKTADAGLVVAATSLQDGQSNISLINADGQIKTSQKISESLTNLEVLGNLAAIGSGTQVLVTDFTAGKTVLERNVGAEVIRVGFAGESKLTVVTRTGVLSLSLK